MSGVATAVAVVGAGASIYGSSKAAKASRQGADQAAGVQQYMYDTTRQDMAPYRDVGVSALDKLAGMYGLDSPGSGSTNQYGRSTNPETTYQYSQSGKVNDYEVVQAYNEFLGRDPTETELQYYTGRERGDQLYYDVVQPGMERTQSNAPQQEFQGGSKTNPGRFDDFYDSPDYKFAFEQGSRAVNQSLAARGLTGSGRAMKELTRFGQGLASQQLQSYTNRLASLAGVGQTATTNLAHIGQNTANQIAGARQNAGDARASGYLGAANAVNNGLQQGYGMWQFNKMMNS